METGVKIAIKGDTSKWNQALGQVRGDAAGLGRKLVGLVGVTAFLALARSTMNYASQLKDLEFRTGIETTRLQQLALVARGAGVDLDTFGTLMEKQAAAIEDASTKNATLRRDLARYGIDARSLARLNTDQQFLAIADAISRMSDAGARVDLVKMIYGKSGGKLLPLMKDGAKGVVDEINRLSGLPIMTPEQIASLKKFSDSFDQLKISVMAGLAPALSHVADVLNIIQGGFMGLGHLVDIVPVEDLLISLLNAKGTLGQMVYLAEDFGTALVDALAGNTALKAIQKLIYDFIGKPMPVESPPPGLPPIPEPTTAANRPGVREPTRFREPPVAPVQPEVPAQQPNPAAVAPAAPQPKRPTVIPPVPEQAGILTAGQFRREAALGAVTSAATAIPAIGPALAAGGMADAVVALGDRLINYWKTTAVGQPRQ